MAALVLGVLYAAVSIYWALGGTWLLDTVGGSLARLGRQRAFGVIAAVWAAALAKLLIAGLPILTLRTACGARAFRWVRGSTLAVALVLTGYGLVLTTVGMLVETGIIPTARSADHRALAWHAFLWDPWFLVWGLLTAAAIPTRGQRASTKP